MNPRMPPLPEPDTSSLAWSGRSVEYINGYEAGFASAADQLLSAQRAAWNAAMEAAVQAVRDDLYPKNERSDWTDFAHDRACTSDALASAIRSLKEPE